MPDSNVKVVTLLSGGMDSTVLLYHLLDAGKNFGASVHALSFDYGQRHRIELDAAIEVCRQAWKRFGSAALSHDVIDLTTFGRLLSGSSLVDRDVSVPEGHYEEETMRATVVPNRNMVMLSIATAVAISDGAHSIAYAAHAGDHAIYPDCRPKFVGALEVAIERGNEGFLPKNFGLISPFLHLTKSQIVTVGLDLGVPFEETWTCYKGRRPACGRCSTCVERLEAFDLSDAQDPLEYADRTYYKGIVKA